MFRTALASVIATLPSAASQYREIWARLAGGAITFFTGGAGNNGVYKQNMVASLQNAGLKNVIATSDSWGFLADAASIPAINRYFGQRQYNANSLQIPVPAGEQLNFIGYSWGSVVSAQGALYVAASGQWIDNVVLVGAPLTAELLDALRNNPTIGAVHVINLTDQGDPVYAGMSNTELIASVPKLAKQFASNDASGHFYYTGSDPEGDRRREGLANDIASFGLK